MEHAQDLVLGSGRGRFGEEFVEVGDIAVGQVEMAFRCEGGLEVLECIHLLLNPFLLDGVLFGDFRDDGLALLAVEERGFRDAFVAGETVAGQFGEVCVWVGEHFFEGREVDAVFGKHNALFRIEEADNP